MRKYLALWICLGMAVVNSARGDDPPAEMKALIAKAVKVHGAEKLAKLNAATWKLKGKFFGMGEAIEYTGEWSVQPPGQQRVQLDMNINGMQITLLRVVNGAEGWQSFNNMTQEMDKESLAEEKEQLYAQRITTLVGLEDKALTLAPLGEIKVGDREAVGVRVSHKDHRDVSLYFDKKSGLLVKSERQIKDVQGGGQLVNQEVFSSDYRETDGVQHAMKILIKRDGKDFVTGEVTEHKLHEKLDNSVFAKP